MLRASKDIYVDAEGNVVSEPSTKGGTFKVAAEGATVNEADLERYGIKTDTFDQHGLTVLTAEDVAREQAEEDARRAAAVRRSGFSQTSVAGAAPVTAQRPRAADGAIESEAPAPAPAGVPPGVGVTAAVTPQGKAAKSDYVPPADNVTDAAK
jgi:hypothetical protein